MPSRATRRPYVIGVESLSAHLVARRTSGGKQRLPQEPLLPDWGGAIAYQLGMHHPERLERLAVVNAPHPARFARGLWRPQQLLRSSYIGLIP